MSSYQQAGIPVDVKRKIARLGINMLLKMVSSRQGGRLAGRRWNCVWEAGDPARPSNWPLAGEGQL